MYGRALVCHLSARLLALSITLTVFSLKSKMTTAEHQGSEHVRVVMGMQPTVPSL